MYQNAVAAFHGILVQTSIPEAFEVLSWILLVVQAVPFAKGQALADEFGIKFFETVS